MERILTPEEEEKDTRRRKNLRERLVMDAYEREGWQITTRGFPCFLARKQGFAARLVWVERKNLDPKKRGLKKSHVRCHSIFTTILGTEGALRHLRIEDPDNPSP